MSRPVIVVENPADWRLGEVGCEVVSVDDYLTDPQFFRLNGVRVINLCAGYDYLSIGYYCSLLAEARRHRPLPSVKSMLDLSSKAMYSLDVVNMDERIQKALRGRDPAQGDSLELAIFFGQGPTEALNELARTLFETFPAPLLKATFRRQERWRLTGIRTLAPARLGRAERERFATALQQYLVRRRPSRRRPAPARYDLAILHDPDESLAPSDPKALERFVRAGRRLGVAVELIERRDYSRLAEYDALFIRETTRINHHTYRFAKRAESEQMVVMDDPQSILRCTNKVYLAELLRANRVPSPKTVIAGRADLEAAEAAIGYPMVLKIPDGSFSRGVVKAGDRAQMLEQAQPLLEQSELILCQEFIYTEFDWRIGILNRQPLWACQYFMSKRHWQIVRHAQDGRVIEGAWRTLPVEAVPPAVVRTALKAAGLVGDGLYGVDIKETTRGPVVIEINDNPSLDAGVEDGYLKERLYEAIMGEFVRRLDLRRELSRARRRTKGADGASPVAAVAVEGPDGQ